MIKTRPSLFLDFVNSRQLDPRVTFSRASTATRVNEVGAIEVVQNNMPRFDYAPADEPVLGADLLTNGDFSADIGSWTTIATGENGTAVTAGRLIVNRAASGGAYQSFATVPGKSYIATIVGRAGTSAINVRIADDKYNGTLLSESPTVNDLVDKNISISFVAISTTTVIYLRVIAGSGGTGEFDTAMVREVTSYNARKGECRGLLMEPNRTNLAKWSEDINSGCTLSGAISATANTATRNGTGNAYVAQLVGPVVVGNAVTFSVYAKPISAGGRLGLRISGAYPNRVDAVFDLMTGSVIGVVAHSFTEASAKISQPNRDGLMRCEVTATVGGSDCVQVMFGPTDPSMPTAGWEGRSSVLSDVFITRRQVEVSRFSTSYIPTTNAEATRAADFATVANTQGWYSASEGAIFAEFARSAVSQYPEAGNRQVVLLKGTSGNSMGIVTGATSPTQHRFDVMSGSVAQAQIGNAGYVERAVARAAGAYATDSFGFSHSGQLPTEDSAGSVPAISMLQIGSAAGSDALTGWIRKVSYFPQRLSRTELQELVAQ